MQPWQRKIRKAHAKQARAVTNADWAASLCKVLLWYGERHPDAGIDVEYVRQVLEARPQWSKVTIRRDKSGFSVEIGFIRVQYRTVSNRGLPPLPTSYTET